jgi:hypothetical protein
MAVYHTLNLGRRFAVTQILGHFLQALVQPFLFSPINPAQRKGAALWMNPSHFLRRGITIRRLFHSRGAGFLSSVSCSFFSWLPLLSFWSDLCISPLGSRQNGSGSRAGGAASMYNRKCCHFTYFQYPLRVRARHFFFRHKLTREKIDLNTWAHQQELTRHHDVPHVAHKM